MTQEGGERNERGLGLLRGTKIGHQGSHTGVPLSSTARPSRDHSVITWELCDCSQQLFIKLGMLGVCAPEG
jgi:hypothetical protein